MCGINSAVSGGSKETHTHQTNTWYVRNKYCWQYVIPRGDTHDEADRRHCHMVVSKLPPPAAMHLTPWTCFAACYGGDYKQTKRGWHWKSHGTIVVHTRSLSHMFSSFGLRYVLMILRKDLSSNAKLCRMCLMMAYSEINIPIYRI